LLEELRAHMTRLEMWIQGLELSAPQELKLALRVRPEFLDVLKQSYVGFDAVEIDRAVVTLGGALAAQVSELHERFELRRSRATDLAAISIVTNRQVA